MIQFKVVVGLFCFSLVAADVRDIAGRYQSTNNRFGSPNTLSSGSFSSNVNGLKSGGTFTASNGQLVQQSFNSNGAPTFTSNNFNGGNTKTNFNGKTYRSHNVGSTSNQYKTNTNTNHYQNQKRNLNTNNDFQCFSAWCQNLDLNQNIIQQHPQKQQQQQIQITPNKHNHNTQNIFSNQVPQTYFNAFTQSSPNHKQNQIPSTHNTNIDTFRKFSGDSFSSGSFTVSRIPCSGAGKVCAPKQFCSNGAISESQVSSLSSKSNTCDSYTETCCTIQRRSLPLQQQPQQQSSYCNPPDGACVSPNYCSNGFIDQRAEKTIRARPSSDRCYAPEICCRFTSSKLSAYNYPRPDNDVGASSNVLTNEGYVVKVPDNKYLPVRPEPSNTVSVTQRPTTTTTTTKKPYVPNTYIPPVDKIPDGSNNNPTILRPIIQSTQVFPAACAAAMNCTPVEYCSSTGVISKTPVILTPEQELYRVPMTDCRDIKTGVVGKCCRDPDYVDPWPVGLLGQYNAEILGFDDGSYKPERRKRNEGKYNHNLYKS